MDVALLQTTYNAFTSLNAHQQLQQQQQQQQTSTSNNIDYSKLPPELNLFHYALYMSRTIGKPQEVYTNKELTKNIAKSQESDLIKKMNHVKRKIDDEEKVKKGKTKQDKVQSTFTSRPKNPFFKNSTSHISIAPSATTSATPTDADAYEEIITVSDDEMAAAAAAAATAAGLDETRSSKYEKQPQQQQQQQFHFQFHPHRRNSPTRSSRNLQQLQQKQSSSHSLPGTFSTTDMFDGGWMNAGLCDPQLLWLNTLISRLFMDFLRERYWVEKIQEKIEKKLSKIHVPHIMDQLTVTGIDLGSNVPVICRSHKPYLDDRGFWVDLQVSYPGGFCITMVSKCNLMKLKHPKQKPAQPQQNIAKDGEVLVSNEEVGANNNTASNTTVTTATTASTPGYVSAVNAKKNDAPAKKIAALDSDDEDSAESSTDEEYPLVDEGDEDDVDRAVTSGKQVQPIGKRIMKLVDRISQSKYFQQAVEMKYIKRALEEVSNTKLELNVEVKSLVGSLAINIPPPPTDRLWYGFRGNPIFELAVRPRVGLREVSLKPVTDWIEKKLSLEFQRSFVMPNMDDFRIPLMLDHMTS
ncbi:hypothetical protein HELRODRAFT_116105 [Helobdella robusta]|uniref:SMP-LTD domain-containing protein n=1 Tax=Helobdella robusta TaxID=6412 RepID=T1EGD0_HELRO|nr:hypothetical protein HELRODRAFT_116105 [Helobdella robusta]ESN92111.1 hypothetical protein HELRODRAFT_116105 [Helobdella robusta]